MNLAILAALFAVRYALPAAFNYVDSFIWPAALVYGLLDAYRGQMINLALVLPSLSEQAAKRQREKDAGHYL